MTEKKSRQFTGKEKLFLIVTSPIGVPVAVLLFFVCYIPSFIVRVYQLTQRKLDKEQEDA